MNLRAWGWWIMLVFATVTEVHGAQLQGLTLSQQQGGKVSLYFTLKGAFTYQWFSLSNPDRVVLDFSGATLGPNFKPFSVKSPLIQQLRSGFSNAKTLRVVLDLKQKVKVFSSPWHDGAGIQGVRLDLIPGRTIKPEAIQNARVVTDKRPISLPHSPLRSYLREVVVVLDAGHGGKDPGAKGPGTSQEKNVVLAITLKLKHLIDQQPGMRAVLTRTGDYYVGLRDRLAIARKYNGDVFVSIHADAFNNPHSNGASVFALSQSGATSEAARWIAEKENYSELGGVNLGSLDDSDGIVRSVLIDLSQTATINSGLQMGARVLKQLDVFTRLHNDKVEQARFMVLKSPDIPSILVETGFISNPREEKNLTSFAYQVRLSQAIFQGIKMYFFENPPHGTRLEAMLTNRLTTGSRPGKA